MGGLTAVAWKDTREVHMLSNRDQQSVEINFWVERKKNLKVAHFRMPQ
jgi:hypothetical protein